MGSLSRATRGQPTAADRERAAATLRSRAADSEVSSREMATRLEAVFRARTSAELSAATSALPSSAIADADVIMARGVSEGDVRRSTSRMARVVIGAAILLALELLVWTVTGLGAGYLAIVMLGTATVFTTRVIRRGRDGSLLRDLSSRH